MAGMEMSRTAFRMHIDQLDTPVAVVDLGELFGAEEMMAVSQVHIDATLYMVDAGVEEAKK